MPNVTEMLSPDDLQKVVGLHMLARGVVEGFISGLHRSPHKGNSIEFKQHRQYVPGDDLRALDWKVYGKTDRFFVREFEEETNLRATLLLDCSGSMGYGGGAMRREAANAREQTLSKREYAIRLAACLSYLMLRQQDGVGLATFDDRVRKLIPPRSNPKHLAVLLEAMSACAAGGETDLGRIFHELAPKLQRRGLVVLLSDCFGDVTALVRGLTHFRQARHDVIVFQVWHRDELDFPFKGQVRFEDMEHGDHRRMMDAGVLRRQYLLRLDRFRSQLREGCARHRVELVPLVTDEPYAKVLREYLVRRGGRGLRSRTATSPGGGS